MRVWSHITKAQWRQLERGRLRADAALVMKRNPYYIVAYRWMIKQMEKRIGVAPEGVTFPLWAWRAYDGEVARPDIENDDIYIGCDDYMVRLDIPDDQVLVSDFNLWHNVLNFSYLPKNDEEARMIEEHWKTPYRSDIRTEDMLPWDAKFSICKAEIMIATGDVEYAKFKAMELAYGESWEQIFDSGYSVEGYADENPRLQAVAWEFTLDQVCGLEHINRRRKLGEIWAAYKGWRQSRRFWKNYRPSEEEIRWQEVLKW